MNAKRILILQDDFPPHSFGGAGVVASNVVGQLLKSRHEVAVVTAVQDEKDAGIEKRDRLTIYRIVAQYSDNFQAYKCLWNPNSVRSVKKILKEFKPDVVHAHGVHAYLSYWSLVVAKKYGARVIFTCHDVQSFNYGKLVDFIDQKDFSIGKEYDYKIDPWLQFRQRKFRYNPFRNAVIRWILRNYVDVITAVSFELKKALETNGIAPVSVAHNGIDTEAWIPHDAQNNNFKQKHKLGDSVILFGGRISPIKGSDKLLEALVDVRKEVPDVQLLVASQKDEFFTRLVEKAKRLGLSNAVIGTGWISEDELKAAYYCSSVVVVPTLSFDSFPTMNLEAFACKRPVVATCFGGSREVVEDGISGSIINPYNVSMLAQKLIELLTDSKKATEFGQNGFNRMVREFSLERQVREYEKIYHL